MWANTQLVVCTCTRLMWFWYAAAEPSEVAQYTALTKNLLNYTLTNQMSWECTVLLLLHFCPVSLSVWYKKLKRRKKEFAIFVRAIKIIVQKRWINGAIVYDFMTNNYVLHDLWLRGRSKLQGKIYVVCYTIGVSFGTLRETYGLASKWDLPLALDSDLCCKELFYG